MVTAENNNETGVTVTDWKSLGAIDNVGQYRVFGTNAAGGFMARVSIDRAGNAALSDHNLGEMGVSMRLAVIDAAVSAIQGGM